MRDCKSRVKPFYEFVNHIFIKTCTTIRSNVNLHLESIERINPKQYVCYCFDIGPRRLRVKRKATKIKLKILQEKVIHALIKIKLDSQ